MDAVKPLSDQEVFNAALFGIRVQGYEQSRGPNPFQPSADTYSVDVCVYRSITTGRRCAIGHSIPDSVYSSSLEGFTIHQLMNKSEAIRILFQGVSPRLMQDLQDIHDRLDGCPKNQRPGTFERLMSSLARRFNLLYTPVQTKELS